MGVGGVDRRGDQQLAHRQGRAGAGEQQAEAYGRIAVMGGKDGEVVHAASLHPPPVRRQWTAAPDKPSWARRSDVVR